MELLIRQAHSEIAKVFKLGIKWCAEHGEKLDLRNYAVICCKLMIDQCAQYCSSNEQRELFLSEICAKLSEHKINDSFD